METLQLDVPDFQKFRAHVNSIPFVRDRVLIETLYLTAARDCELLTETCPWDLAKQNSKPYGLFLRWKREDYEVSPAKNGNPAVREKVLLITMAVAKRMKGKHKVKDSSTLTKEQIAEYLPTTMRDDYLQKPDSVDPLLVRAFLGEMTLKIIALPCSSKFEPWTQDILGYALQTKMQVFLKFDLTRSRVWQIERRWLDPFLKAKSKRNVRNPLRHFRITHLIENYNLNDHDIQLISGWTFSTAAGMFGIVASPQIGEYAHLKWRDYFGKLLKPIDEIA
jgi:hypothetical protein